MLREFGKKEILSVRGRQMTLASVVNGANAFDALRLFAATAVIVTHSFHLSKAPVFAHGDPLT